MLTTPHVLVALTIFKILPDSPIMAFFLILISHFVIDFCIPHWNPHLFTEFKKSGRISLRSMQIILIDAFLALTILTLMVINVWPNYSVVFGYTLAAFLGILPDFIEIPHYFLRWKNKLLTKYVVFQHQHQANGTFFWGILTQIIVIAACFKQLFF